MCLINMTAMSVRAGWNLSCAATAEECHMPEGHNKLCLPQKNRLCRLWRQISVFSTIEEEAGWESLKEAFPEDSRPGLAGAALVLHWWCTGGALLGVFSLQVSGSAELSALYQNSLWSRAVDLGSPALEFASAFDWKTNSECDMQLMQSGRIVWIEWRRRRGTQAAL